MTGCSYCTGAAWWGVVPPSPCGPGCRYYGNTAAAPQQFHGFVQPTYPFVPIPPRLSDEDVERIAARVAELMRAPVAPKRPEVEPADIDPRHMAPGTYA